MKHIAIVSLFASLLAAQTPSPAKPDPSRELAKIIAVEEQERDLAKAEAMYREAIAGTTLSKEAQALANMRLGELLFRLGRQEEAKQFLAKAVELDGSLLVAFDNNSDPQPKQDPEREKALREKARELVQQALSNSRGGQLDQAVHSRLLWIGESAIPEIAAGLATEQREGLNSNRRSDRHGTVAGLALVLWLLGSESAASHLDALWSASENVFRRQLALHVGQLREPRMLRLVEKWLLQEKDDGVCRTLLLSNSPQGVLFNRMDPDVVIKVARSQSVAVQALLLTSASSVSERLAVHFVELSRTLLAGSDPEGGRAAQSFLKGSSALALPAGVDLLLEQLPALENTNQGISSDVPSAWRDSSGWFTEDVVRRLWPRLMQCAQKLPPDHMGWDWLRSLIRRSLEKVDASGILELIDVAPRFPQSGNWGFEPDWLSGRVDMANAAKVFSLYDKLRKSARGALLSALAQSQELPIDLFAPLRERLHERSSDGPGPWDFLRAMARTGHAGVVEEVMLAWRADPKKASSDTAAWLLLRPARKNPSEATRAAMRELLDPKTPFDPQHGNRPRLLLALLSMHDAAALPLLDKDAVDQTKHPYATRQDKPELTPHEYLLARDADPPHGFTEEEILALLPSWFAGGIPPVLHAGQCQVALGDRVLGEVARLALHSRSIRGEGQLGDQHSAWLDRVLARIRQESGCPAELKSWLPSMLLAPVPLIVLERMTEEEVKANRDALVALTDQENETIAAEAESKLRQAGIPLAPERLFSSRHPRVRMRLTDVAGQQEFVRKLLRDIVGNVRMDAAMHCGNVLDKEAVPSLLALLSDPEQHVRKAAAEALTKIRFYHEQQAHWDRVLKGLDASPANAAEKLLLQAKPDAPKAQRLLAITSLGTLGVPEALPFLIDWTADPDAEIQKAAKDAITQIHLSPRK